MRQKLCEEYYQLDSYARQKDFIMNNVREMKPKAQILSSQRHHKVSRGYYLPCSGERKRVCANFFCKTLDLKIRAIQTFFEIHSDSLAVGSPVDGRGRNEECTQTQTEECTQTQTSSLAVELNEAAH